MRKCHSAFKLLAWLLLPLQAVWPDPAGAASPGPAEERSAPAVQADAPLKITSYGQVQYSRTDGSPDSFSVSRLRLSLEGRVARFLRFKTTVDAVKTPILLDAGMDIELFRGGSLRLGQFKVPFSQESLTASSDRDFINLPRSVASLVPGRDIGASGRDIGAVLQYKAGRLETTAGLFNGSGINKADANREKDLAGRLVYSPAKPLRLGGSVYKGCYSPAAGQKAARRDRAGLEMALMLSRMAFKAEYILARDGAVSKSGGYAQAGVFLAPDRWQILARFDSLDSGETAAPGRNDAWTLGLNRFFAPKTKFQLNLEWKRDRESGRPTEFRLSAMFQAGF